MLLAQIPNPFKGVSPKGPGPVLGFDLNHGTVGTLISAVLPYVFAAAGIALLIYLVLGGFQLMTAKGDPKAMQGAQAKITNALLGFVIIFISYWIVQIFGQLLGITQIGAIFK